MARLFYGGTAADFAVALGESIEIPDSSPSADGRVALIPEDAVTLLVYDDDDGEQVDDLLSAAGVPISSIETSTVDGSLGIIPRFQGPDGWAADLFLSSDGTNFFRFAPSTDPLWDRVTVVEGKVDGLQLGDLVDVDATGATGQVVTKQADGSFGLDDAGSGSVSSVNGQTPTAGAVTLTAANVGAGTASGQAALAAIATAVLLQSGGGYPARPSVAVHVTYVGTATPSTGLVDGDIWHQPGTS